MKKTITIIGGGLAGCEAAWQLLRRGHQVCLYEMKPRKFSPAHKMENLAELVCSNSLKSNLLDNASGLLKEEMRRLNSLIIQAADATAVAAGSALAVDRVRFAAEVETRLLREKNFSLVREEVTDIRPDVPTVIATGPLTSDALARSLVALLDHPYLYFYDAIAPIVEADSINMDKVYWASRYDKGTPDYLNCPLDRMEYERLRHEILAGEKVPLKSFEEVKHFEGCLPVEVLAERGEKSLAFGPLKPVGLQDPRTGIRPYAVVQLRRENAAGTLFNMVGFQTKLTWPEQRRIFRMIPGLENAEFARYGSIHRNTFIHSPSLLRPSLQCRKNENIFFAGQITGVEGYVESAAMGLLAGLNAAYLLERKTLQPPPASTAVGALLHYIVSPASADHFQPMNVHFGIMETSWSPQIGKKNKKSYIVKCALEALNAWANNQEIPMI